MTPELIVNAALLLLLAGNLILLFLDKRTHKRNEKTTQTWLGLIENAQALCDRATEKLMEASYTATAVQHQRYTADADSIPDKITVKCEDCGEQVGIADSQWEVRDLALNHVEQKYREAGEKAKTLTKDNLQAMLNAMEAAK